MKRLVVWAGFSFILVHAHALAQNGNDEAKRLEAELARLEKEEPRLREAFRTAVAAGQAHADTKEKVKLTDKVAVRNWNETAKKLRKAIDQSEAEVHQNIQRQIPLDDRIRLARLLQRKKTVDETTKRAEERVKKTQAFLKRLGEESIKDVKELEAMIKASDDASEAGLKQSLNVLVRLPTVASAIPEFDLRHYAGDGWHKTFREGIKRVREFQEFMAKEKVRERFADVALGKSVFDKEEISLEKGAEAAARVGEFLGKEVKPHLSDIGALLDVVRGKDSVDLKLRHGVRSIRVLGEACELFVVGNIAIDSCAAGYQQYFVCRDLRKALANNTIENRNAIIKSFQKGGAANFIKYDMDVKAAKVLHEEQRLVDAEIKTIRARLAPAGK